ncbi:MAG: hypothetical protein FJ296_00735 [Planctomycetes bacterium]|nr:hypothetical protein [Planctomycetota bacterium]
MNRSLELRGLQTGILASRLPANLDGYWNDVVSGNKTKVTLQVRVQGLDLSQVGETDIPYSLDYNGKHERPTESKITVAGGTPPCTAYDYYKRTTTALGYESVDALLWKPPAATNRYDTTGNKKYPWVPGNTAADVSLAAAEKVRPKMACVLGTGPLREFPLWHTNNSQRTWATQVAGGVPDWRNSYRTADVGLPVSAGALRYPAPLATSANVLAGNCDPGDLYIFWVWSPFTQNWHLMALWEYSDPGVSTGSFHAQGMNRMFVFAGWGQEGSNVAAAALDPTQAHTITISLERDFTNGNNSRLEIGVDGASGMYGEVLAVPLPASGDIGGAGNAAPRFGLQSCPASSTSPASATATPGAGARSISVGCPRPPTSAAYTATAAGTRSTLAAWPA